MALLRSHARFNVLVTIFAGAILLLPSILGIITYHPFELSYFNGLIGDIRGARRIGMETTYWGESSLASLKYLNGVRRHARIAVLCGNSAVMSEYQRAGALRNDFYVVGHRTEDILRADFVVLICRMGMFDDVCWALYQKAKPVYTVQSHGVPLALTYKTSGLPQSIVKTIHVGDNTGWLVHGPYLSVGPGEYKVIFNLKTGDNATTHPVAVIDVAACGGGKRFAYAELRGTDFFSSHTYQKFELYFDSHGVEDLEFRVWYCGNSSLFLDKVILVGEMEAGESIRTVVEAEGENFGHQVGSLVFDENASGKETWGCWDNIVGR